MKLLASILTLFFVLGCTSVELQKEPKLIHPKVFKMIDCWVSDTVQPVVTEISLKAVESNNDEFDYDEIEELNGWIYYPLEEFNGFYRYKIISKNRNKYKVLYQSNGGGTFTSSSLIEFTIEKRSIQIDDKPNLLEILQVNSIKTITYNKANRILGSLK